MKLSNSTTQAIQMDFSEIDKVAGKYQPFANNKTPILAEDMGELMASAFVQEWQKREKENANFVTKPFLKWAGGKHKLVPFIESHLPEKRQRLIEPFAGLGALSLALEFEEYHLNDINSDLKIHYLSLKLNFNKYQAQLMKNCKLVILNASNTPNLFIS